MAFREKTAWISLILMISIYGWYFWSISQPGSALAMAPTGAIWLTTVMLVVGQILSMAVVAAGRSKEAAAGLDEHDTLINLRSTRVAYLGLLSVIALALAFAAFNLPVPVGANWLLFLLVAAEVLKSICQIVQYRRNA